MFLYLCQIFSEAEARKLPTSTKRVASDLSNIVFSGKYDFLQCSTALKCIFSDFCHFRWNRDFLYLRLFKCRSSDLCYALRYCHLCAVTCIAGHLSIHNNEIIAARFLDTHCLRKVFPVSVTVCFISSLWHINSFKTCHAVKNIIIPGIACGWRCFSEEAHCFYPCHSIERQFITVMCVYGSYAPAYCKCCDSCHSGKYFSWKICNFIRYHQLSCKSAATTECVIVHALKIFRQL